MFWTTEAYAFSNAAAQGANDPMGGLGPFIPLILMFAVFYFLLIRPQQKRAKEHKAMLAALGRGDEVITMGGLYGRIIEAHDEYVILDLGDTKVKVSRSAINAVPSAQRVAEKQAQKAKKDDEAGK